MARKDVFHDHVRKALENDGWTITDDPYKIKVGGIYQEIDLAAEKLIAAERGSDKIAIEVKSFIDKSHLTNFHEALGKFRNYRRALRKKDPERILYLAIPEPVYNKFFTKEFIQEAIVEEELLLAIYSVTETIIVSWIK
jgi:XisH protein